MSEQSDLQLSDQAHEYSLHQMLFQFDDWANNYKIYFWEFVEGCQEIRNSTVTVDVVPSN